MPRVYRNARNQERAREVERAALVGEAGEVFTPVNVVTDLLDDPLVKAAILGSGFILEPSAGDGNFVIPVLQRLVIGSLEKDCSAPAALEAASRLYAVEILEDNLSALRERAKETLTALLPEMPEKTIDDFCAKQYVRGSFLTERACTLSCGETCTACAALELPKQYSLIVGNPPYNPGAVYTDFVRKAIAKADVTAFVLPTTWKVAPRYTSFRSEVGEHLARVDDLPWKTFAIKLRTCRAIFTKATVSQCFVNGEETTLVDAENYRVMNSVLRKAFSKWSSSLESYKLDDECKLSIGWKCNLEKDTGRVNYLQSIGFEDTPMPNNVYDFYFSNESERLAFVKYSTSKLAAYLQCCIDSDSVARYLPLPPLTLSDYSDQALYRELGLTKAEVACVEAFDVFISARAKKFYDELGVAVRSDAVVGAARKTCSACGSSSFHKKGCANSTAKERELRDK